MDKFFIFLTISTFCVAIVCDTDHRMTSSQIVDEIDRCFVTNNQDLTMRSVKRFYVDKTRSIRDDSNKKWCDIVELQSLFKKTTNWSPRPKCKNFEIKNVTLMDILKVCINGCISDTFNSGLADCAVYGNRGERWTPILEIVTSECLDFVGYNDVDDGDCLLDQQKGGYISEIFKCDNGGNTYTVVISAIKNVPVHFNFERVGERLKNFVKPLDFIGISDGITRYRRFHTKSGSGRRIYSGEREFSIDKEDNYWRCNIAEDMHSVIYILKVSKDKYDNFIKNAKKYNAI